MPHGDGKVVIEEEVFEGTWLYGKREGLFVGKSKLGVVINKNYKNGKLNGWVKTTYNDGESKIYNHKNAKSNGCCQIVKCNGEVDNTNYKYGKYHCYIKCRLFIEHDE